MADAAENAEELTAAENAEEQAAGEAPKHRLQPKCLMKSRGTRLVLRPSGCSQLFGFSAAVCSSAVGLQYVLRLFGCISHSAIRPLGCSFSPPVGN